MPYSTTPNKIPIQQIKRRTVLYFTIATILISAGACFLLFITLGRIADKKESRLLESTAIEMSIALQNYLSECETHCTDVFLNEKINEYAPYMTDYMNSDYEQEQRRNEVKKELAKISAGKCYNDFFIIYSNSDAVGNVSQGAADIAANKGYKAFSAALVDNKDIWAFGTISGMNKIFYLRRLNSSSIFVMSCYIDNLKMVFPEHRDASVVNYILADSDGKVITSDMTDLNTGDIVPKKFVSLFGSDNEVVIDDFYIVARMTQDNGWKVYTVTKNSDFIPNYTIIITIVTIALSIIVLICLVTGVFTFLPITRSDNGQFTGSEYLDAITGTLNEYGLDEKISDMLETSLVGSTYAFIMIGIKDSEQIKSTVSLRYWNDIRLTLAEKAEDFFADKKHHTGRAYDDFIVVFVDYSEFDLFKAHDELRKGCEELCKSFDDFTAGVDGSLKLNVAIGASIYPDHGDDFDTLLGKARQAYKEADSSEKSGFRIFKQRGTDENGKGDE